MALLIDQLILQGVTHFFVAPGSRSTPLVLAAGRHPQAKVHRHFDERGLGFYALGCAMAQEAPVAIIVTSGTAVGNLLPAIMEAHHASIPLLILTADRPPEWRETSSNQTTRQTDLFTPFVRHQFDLCPSMSPQAIASQAAHAVWRTRFPHPGPVHLNCPFAEPLYPVPSKTFSSRPVALSTATGGKLELPPFPSKGILLAGRLPRREDLFSVLALAQKLQWPLFADLLSQGRLYPTEEQMGSFDSLLNRSDTPAPECILHFGERLTSTALSQWLSAIAPAQYWHISPHAHWLDPSHLLTGRIASEIPAACEAISLEHPVSSEWLAQWKQLPRKSEEEPDEGSEVELFQRLSRAPLEEWAFFLGNSMPIREAEKKLFPSRAKGFFSNRGLSGIDGNIATAVGLAQGLQTGVVAFLGDLTTLHDLNSLALMAESPHPVLLIISNNQGGRIFSQLPVSQDPLCEELIAFRHPWSFARGAALFNLPYGRVEGGDDFQRQLEEGVRRRRSMVLEAVTLRTENGPLTRELRQRKENLV